MRKIVFANKASEALVQQALYIYEQTSSVELSDKYLDVMQEFISATLLAFPKAGRPSDDLAPDTRKLVYKGYSIIYQIGKENIEILTLYRENLK